MKIFESKTATVVRAAAGILLSIALTAGAAMGVAAELQRGFSPVFEATANRRAAESASLAKARPATNQARTKTAARAVAPSPQGG